MTCGRWHACDVSFQRLAQDLQDMAAKLGEFIQEEHVVVGQRDFARHRHVAPTNQPHIRNGVVGRAKWAGRDPRRAVAGEAGDTVDGGRNPGAPLRGGSDDLCGFSSPRNEDQG